MLDSGLSSLRQTLKFDTNIRIWIKTGAVFEAIGGPLKAAVVTQMFIQQSVKFASKMCYCWGTAQFGAVC